MAEINAPLFSADGSQKGEVSLDASVFGIEPNIPVMHQVVTAQMAGARSGSASTKTRAEVRGGGRKPWRQKGLGRARHGSIRSPQWTGGGVAFGPKPRDYSQRTPKKMKKLALRGALSALLEAIDAGRKILVVLGAGDRVAELSFRNLPNVLTCEPGHLTTYDVLWAETLVFTSETLGSVTGLEKFDVADDDFVKEQSAVSDRPSAESDEGGEG